ncbi:hypothetical protein KI688_003127 [Linnemannia hyalina]|uniref:Uncharacterized protein n=1 Tax=Linnemannia hyalina TaxID=64524 RepID=A0A9P7XPM3_9FUNG|nr:hypothetical protein KI688_003127 [Linnemannia hyalina]
MLPQGDDLPSDQAAGDSPAPSDNILHPLHQQQERPHIPTSPTSTTTTPLVKAVTTTLSSLEDISLTFCNRPPLPFRFPSSGSQGSEHDETIIRMVDDEQSWGDIEALAGEEAFDRYYSFLDPGLEEFWTLDRIKQLNDAVIDHVGRFLKPRAETILKGTQKHHHQQWHSKNNKTNGDNDSEGEDVKKVATLYPVVVMSAWMDMCRWEKVARSVDSSPLVCQHIWETVGDGRPFTEEEQHVLDEIKVAVIENGARVSAIKDAAARVEAAKAKAAQEEADRLEAAGIKAAREEEGRIEAAVIKAAQDEADRNEAERLEAERIKAAEAEAKRVEAKKTKAVKRRAKADAAREKAEKESKVGKVLKRKKSGDSIAAKELATRQKIILMQENIARQEAALTEVTRRQTAKEVNEDARGTSKVKRETALAAAKAWEMAVRGMVARKAEIQSVAAKRQCNVSRSQADLDRDQDLSLSSGSTLENKRKIGKMEALLPPATFNPTTTTTTADQEDRPPQQDTIVPRPILRSSSSISCSSLISPAPSPQGESLDFQLSKHTRRCSSPETLSVSTVTSTETKATTPTPTAIKSTTKTSPPPAPLLSDNHDTAPKAPSFTLSNLPPTSFPQGADVQERIKKLTTMKKVLTDCSQTMELQCQDQRAETDILLRQRDAAIKAAKARRQRGDSNNTSSHHENDRTNSFQNPPEGRILASFNAPEKSTPVRTGLPSPVTPNQHPVSLSPEFPAAAPKTASPPVIDLTEDDEHGLSIATSAMQQQSLPQHDHRPQQLPPLQQQQQESQQILQAQQCYHRQQYFVQQRLQQSQQQRQQQQQQLQLPQQQQPLLQHPQPTKSLGLPVQPVQSSFPQASPNHQQMQEFLLEQVRKSPELHKLHQQHAIEKKQLIKQQQLDRQRLADQQLVTAQHLAYQRHSDEQLHLAAVDKWRQREQAWTRRMQEIHQKEQILGSKLEVHRQHNLQLRQAILLGEQKQRQQQPAVTPEQIKQLHMNQRLQLATSQQHSYTALQSAPVAQQVQAMVNLHRLCMAEAQALLTQQKGSKEKADCLFHRQEETRRAVQLLQLQLHQVQGNEMAVLKLLEGLHVQRQEQERERIALLQEHQFLQQKLQIIPASSSSSLSLPQGPMAAQGTAPVNLAASQQQQQQQLLNEKYVMDEQLRQQLSQQRDIQRKQHLQDQVDLQKAQKNALLRQERIIANVRLQGLTQTTSQDQPGQSWSGVQAQQQQQAQTIMVQEQQVSKGGPPAFVFPTFPNPLNRPSATKPISLPPQPAPVVQDPLQPQPESPPLQAPATAQPQQPTSTSQPSQRPTSGTALTSAPPTTQHQQPRPESTTAASRLAAIFPFPNLQYDITEWTAEDKNRLWTTWLEVGDDWEQISTKGLRGKFSAEACRAVILGTAS